MPNAYINNIYPPEPADPSTGRQGRKSYKIQANVEGTDTDLFVSAKDWDKLGLVQGNEYALTINMFEPREGVQIPFINAAAPTGPVTVPSGNGQAGSPTTPAYQLEKDARMAAGLGMKVMSQRVPAGATREEEMQAAREYMLMHEQLTEEWVRHLESEVQKSAEGGTDPDTSDIPF